MKAILWYHLTFWLTIQGRSQDFSKGGEVTLCQSEGTHQILMSTSTPCFGLMWHVSDVVGLVKRGLQKGGSLAKRGVTGTPWLRPCHPLKIPSVLKIELSEYLTKADGIAEAVDEVQQCKTNEADLLLRTSAAKLDLRLQPSTAASKQVFPILTLSFGGNGITRLYRMLAYTTVQ